jgi:putative FmdB family regulatory protein
MPVYEYQCKSCGRDFEYQQRMTDPEKTTCEACGGALDRLISRTAFSLKGGGWYKDLYASPKPEAAAKADGGDASNGKADAKPAPKTDAPAPAATADKPAAKSSDPGGGSGSGSSGGGSGSGGSSGGTGTPSSGSVTKAS